MADFDTAKEMYTMYVDAEKALLTSKSYTLADGTSLTRVDLGDIRDNMAYWKKQMNIADPLKKKTSGIQMKTVRFKYVD